MQKGTTVRKKRLHTGIRLLAVLMVFALLCLDQEAVSGSAKLDLRQELESRYGTEYSREIGITEAGAQLMEQMTISITPAHKIGPRRWLRNYTETPVRYLCSVRYDRSLVLEGATQLAGNLIFTYTGFDDQKLYSEKRAWIEPDTLKITEPTADAASLFAIDPPQP